MAALHQIQDAAHMLRYYKNRYKEPPSSAIARRAKHTAKGVLDAENQVRFLEEALHWLASYFQVPIETYVVSKGMGPTARAAASVLVTHFVKRKQQLQSASPTLRADIDRVLKLQDSSIHSLMQEAVRADQVKNRGTKSSPKMSRVSRDQQISWLRQFLEAEERLPVELRLGIFHKAFYQSGILRLKRGA